MTLVLTTDFGPSQSIRDVSTPAQSPLSTRALTLDSTLVANASSIAGASVTDALNALQTGAAFLAPIVSSIGWNAAAPLVLTNVPAGHAAGIYLVSLCVIVRTAPTTGTATRSYQYTAPIFGATQVVGFGGTSLTTTGNVAAAFQSLSIMSAGTGAINVTLTPAAITGPTPVIDVYSSATRVAA